MNQIVLMFKAHQPYRISDYSFFDLGTHQDYFNDKLNAAILDKVATRCYLPANKMLLRLIRQHNGLFKCNLSLSGILIEQLEQYRHDVLESFIELAQTGCVEFLCEPYYHSLCSLFSPAEFDQQIEKHRKKVNDIFGQAPVSCINTELIYNDYVAHQVASLHFDNILTEGVSFRTGHNNFSKVFTPIDLDLNVYFRDHEFSNDIGFRFSDPTWNAYPLTPVKYANWIEMSKKPLINLFMDYETFGEHHSKETGIFSFFTGWVHHMMKKKIYHFANIKDVCNTINEKTPISIPNAISWADAEKDTSAWTGNAMQQEALEGIFQFEHQVRMSHDPKLLETWRKLQISDHFYYMCTKGYTDGQVHQYFNPHGNPHNAYRFYMNILSDLELWLNDTFAPAAPKTNILHRDREVS